MKQQIYRQGDVLIERIEAFPTNLPKKSKGKIILAHGEVTGHAHTIEDRDAADWWKVSEDEQYIAVKSPVEVVHQEHGAIALKRGNYRVRRQREYSPAQIRRVAD